VFRYSGVAAACGLLVLLASGGGGGSDPGGGSSQGTGLVPQAPALGVVLAEDAASLRPMRAGSTWRYHGEERIAEFVTPYDVRVTQQAAGLGAVTERSEGVFQSEPETAELLVQGGAVVSRTTDDLFGTGSSETLTLTELRSPVRANDQITLFERTGVPLGGDVDGDGVSDVGSFAGWSRVIGSESISLSWLGRSMSAIRVDTTVAVRPVLSRTGQPGNVSSATQSVWYAQGVGVVRRRLTNPDGAMNDEVLIAWDGVTDGLGSLGFVPLLLPPPRSAFTLPPVLDAVSAGPDLAFVLTPAVNSSDFETVAVSSLNWDGRVLSVQEVSGLPFAADRTRLARHGTGAALVTNLLPSGGGTAELRTWRFGADGALVSPSGGRLLTTDITSTNVMAPGVAGDGDLLWVVWRAANDTDLLLQAFDLTGNAASVRSVIERFDGAAVRDVRLAANSGSVLVTWARADAQGTSYKVAHQAGVASAPAVRTLGTAQFFGLSQHGESIRPFTSGPIAGITWTGPIFSATAASPLADSVPRGVLLGGDLAPLRSAGGALDSEALRPIWGGSQTPVVPAAAGSRLVLAAAEPFVPDPVLAGQSTNEFLATWATPVGTPLATMPGATTVRIGRGRFEGSASPFQAPPGVRAMLVEGDRALVFSGGVAKVWLR
jgi:hypothetical protein